MQVSIIRLLLVFLSLTLPTMLILYLLLKFYPYTGLGRIITLPFTIIFNGVIIIMGTTWIATLKYPHFMLKWIIVSLLTVFVALISYPQDYGPHVIIKIWSDLK
ncbi:hypothetical protein QFZ81_003745 [Paenibacillus sp. V4I9]|nr:hypothetical protein [Paenibacillus sp. V4I9]